MFLVGSMAGAAAAGAAPLPDGSQIAHRLTVPVTVSSQAVNSAKARSETTTLRIQFMMSNKNTLWMQALLPAGEETASFGPAQINRNKAVAVDLSPYMAQNIFLYHDKVYAVVTRQGDASEMATKYLLQLDPSIGPQPRLLKLNIDTGISLTGVALGSFVLHHAAIYGAGFTFASVCYGLIGAQRLIANAVNSVKHCRAHLRTPARQAVDHAGAPLKFIHFVPGGQGTAADILLESPTSGRRYFLKDLERMSDCEFALID